MKDDLVVAGACLNQIPFAWQHNLENIIGAIEEAKSNGVELLCLPELCITGYGCEDLFLSHWLPEKALKKMLQLLSHTQGITIAIGLPVIFHQKTFNCLCLIQDEKILGFYAKHHLANDGVHYEPRWFESWPVGKIDQFNVNNQVVPFGAFTTQLNGWTLGFEICEDAWKADRPASYYQVRPDIILNPSASHFAFRKAAFREELVRTSSERFECVYLYTNLLGNEAGRMIYDGDVLIARKGRVIARNKRLSFRDRNLLKLTLTSEESDQQTFCQQDWTGENAELSRVIPLALFDYLRKSKSRGFVLSLSGGADSSSIATMVAHMVHLGLSELGREELQRKIGFEIPGDEKSIVQQILKTAYQGTVNSSADTFESAKSLADSLGATFYHWQIDDEVTSYRKKIEGAIGKNLTWETDDIALQNIQARARSPIIWMLANLNRHLLLSTSNRSEGDVGYATMDGDTSGSISPIAAIDKALVLSWLRYAEIELGYEGLEKVNGLQPTAELRPLDQNQKDEDDLMPYSVLVQIEEWGIRERKSPKEVFEILKEKYPREELKKWIIKFFRLWSINQWKRERIAPSFHVDDFNVDPRTWCRFPILSGGFTEELSELSTESD